MENFKKKLIAVLILIVVVGGLVVLTMFAKNKTTSTTGEKTGISLFTKKNTGTKALKNQGNVGNQTETNFTGNDTTKPVSIIENIINTITGKDNSSNSSNSNTVSINNGGIGQVIRDFFLGSDGLPGTGALETTGTGEFADIPGIPGGESNKIPEVSTVVDFTDTDQTNISNPECSPAVYVSKLTRKQDLELEIEINPARKTTLTDEEKEILAWKPTKQEIDEDNMRQVLHRYWDIWSYPDNYLKPDGENCGTWTNPNEGTTEKDFANGIINTNTINAAKRETRKKFSALATIVSSSFSVNQSESQRLIAQSDNKRYDDLVNDCRVIRGQFEGGYTYGLDNKTRITIPQYYFSNAQSGIATGRDNTSSSGTILIADSHEKIASDLARRVQLHTETKNKAEFAKLTAKIKAASMGTFNSGGANTSGLTDAEIKRYQDLLLENRFGGLQLGDLIRAEVVKNKLINWKDDTNILTATTMGNISYLIDRDHPTYDLSVEYPKNKAENMSIFSSPEDARYNLTKYPKLQYGGSTGAKEIRGSTFWSGNQVAMNYNPGMYMIAEPQSVWELLEQDKNKVLFCRLNKFMGQWAGIETNSSPAPYINSHGINCDNALTASEKEIDDFNKKYADQAKRDTSNKLFFIFPFKNDSWEKIKNDYKALALPSFYYPFEESSAMFQFYGFNRDNWYSNSPQNAVFEFIKDED